MCNGSVGQTALTWSITLSQPNQQVHELGIVTTTGFIMQPVELNMTVFQVTRPSQSPLISILQVQNLTAALNGALINCSYRETTLTTRSIQVIGNGIHSHS